MEKTGNTGLLNRIVNMVFKSNGGGRLMDVGGLRGNQATYRNDRSRTFKVNQRLQRKLSRRRKIKARGHRL